MTPHGRRRGRGAQVSGSDTKPTPGGPRPRFRHHSALISSNHSPIYMFAYVVCPNLDATAVLSIYWKLATLNAMPIPIMLSQSEFENVRNAHTHTAMEGIFAAKSTRMQRLCGTHSATSARGRHPLCNMRSGGLHFCPNVVIV
jgi:hypothetical protein